MEAEPEPAWQTRTRGRARGGIYVYIYIYLVLVNFPSRILQALSRALVLSVYTIMYMYVGCVGQVRAEECVCDSHAHLLRAAYPIRARTAGDYTPS